MIYGVALREILRFSPSLLDHNFKFTAKLILKSNSVTLKPLESEPRFDDSC